MRNQLSALASVTLGQPGFFAPRYPSPWSLPAGADGATSYYDTSPLRQTLLQLIDFDILNDQTKRLSVGAVNVRTGNFVYFDTLHDRIEPEHIMASGALPPALPPVEIAGELYWDGGIVSNTPLQYLLDQEDELSSLVFQVDLFSARGELPRDMRAVYARLKDITYSSRTRYNTDTFKRVYALRRRLGEALARIPPELRTPEDEEQLKTLDDIGSVNIVHLIYQQKEYEGNAKDYEFSGTSMRDHWQSGYEDTKRTLRHPEWLAKSKTAAGLIVHDVHAAQD
jgi:NTE family protein